MPTLRQCANCKKYFIKSTYELIQHYVQCVLTQRQTIDNRSVAAVAIIDLISSGEPDAM